MKTRLPTFAFNLSSLLLLTALLAVACCWWLDRQRLSEAIAIERENQRIIIHDLQSANQPFTIYDPQEIGCVFELTAAEAQLNEQVSIDAYRFLELVEFIGMWEASRLGTMQPQDYNVIVEDCRTHYRIGRYRFDSSGLPPIAVAPQAVASFEQFVKDCGMEQLVQGVVKPPPTRR